MRRRRRSGARAGSMRRPGRCTQAGRRLRKPAAACSSPRRTCVGGSGGVACLRILMLIVHVQRVVCCIYMTACAIHCWSARSTRVWAVAHTGACRRCPRRDVRPQAAADASESTALVPLKTADWASAAGAVRLRPPPPPPRLPPLLLLLLLLPPLHQRPTQRLLFGLVSCTQRIGIRHAWNGGR